MALPNGLIWDKYWWKAQWHSANDLLRLPDLCKADWWLNRKKEQRRLTTSAGLVHLVAMGQCLGKVRLASQCLHCH